MHPKQRFGRPNKHLGVSFRCTLQGCEHTIWGTIIENHFEKIPQMLVPISEIVVWDHIFTPFLEHVRMRFGSTIVVAMRDCNVHPDSIVRAALSPITHYGSHRASGHAPPHRHKLRNLRR